MLRALILFLRHTPWHTPPAPAWTDPDARALSTFLATSTGRKLTHLLTSEIATANERAAMSKGSPFDCGWACGYRGLLAWFQSLSAPAPAATGAHDDSPLGAADDFEHFAP